MNRPVRTIGLGLILLLPLASVACSSDATTSSPSAGAENVTSFASAFCAEVMPCCQQASLPSDGAYCRALLSKFAKTYDPAAGAACLTELRESATKSRFCADSMLFGTPTCLRALGSVAAAKPGEGCESSADCAAPTGATARCLSSASAGGTETVCRVTRVGKAGDGPCILTIGGDHEVSEGAVDEGFSCDLGEGLVCDSTSQKCVAARKLSEPCELRVQCVLGAFCGSSGSCVPKIAEGAPCDRLADECVDGSYCKDGKCVKQLATGAACDVLRDECGAGDHCIDDKCGGLNLFKTLCTQD